jgi:hypothetical protein
VNVELGMHQVVVEYGTKNERLWEEWMERRDVKAWRLLTRSFYMIK